MKDLLNKIKNYIYENKQFITASILSAVALIAIIITISFLKGNNKTNIASGGEFYSDYETTSPDDETQSDKTTNLPDNESVSGETTGLSDLEFTLPEDETSETETTMTSDKYPYLVKVNRVLNCVTVYTKDSNGKFTVPYKSMACSTGKYINNTPLGTFKVSSRYTWRLMVDGTHSQYATRFYGGILFHSVPCYSPHKNQLEYEEFNKLGSPASLGCVRLNVQDAKWIYDNCPYGTTVIVYDDETSPGPLGKPSVIKIPEDSPYRGWDPTDPDSSNPWNNCSPSIEASDMTIVANSGINLLNMIKAKDTCGNDVTSTVKISGDYNLTVPGSYQVTFNVTDLLGRSAAKTIILTVTGSSNNGSGVNTNHSGSSNNGSDVNTDHSGSNNNQDDSSTDSTSTTANPTQSTSESSSSETPSPEETTEPITDTTPENSGI